MYRRTLVIFFKRGRALFVFFLFLFFADGFHLVRLIGKKDPVAPQDEKKYIVFFACLMELFAVCPNSTEPGTAEVTEDLCDSEVSHLQICLSVEKSTQYSKNSCRKSFTFSCHSLFGQYDITDPANI